MVKDASFTVHMTDEMREKLRDVSEETGLGQSEIVRRGLLEQLEELEG